MGQVNRSLEDPHMDDIDHALGRPQSAFGGYRNHYVVETDSAQCLAMENSECWQKTRTINEGRDTVFQVTDLGRDALACYLQTI